MTENMWHVTFMADCVGTKHVTCHIYDINMWVACYIYGRRHWDDACDMLYL